MLSIELDIYSGRPNPTWILPENEEKVLVERLIAEPSLMVPLTADTGGLGYRGFIVTALSEDAGSFSKAGLPSSFRMGGDFDKDTAASLWLLDTSEKPDVSVDDYLRDVVKNSIEQHVKVQSDADVSPQGGKMTCRSNFLTSDTNFKFWNGSAFITRNNCYNFASNWRSNTFAQPGIQSGRKFGIMRCKNVSKAVVRDGYANGCVSSNNISICLVMWPGQDFHFYRLCANGHWCHKPGQTPARNFDDAGRLITSVETCNRGFYTKVCAYFYSNSFRVVR